MRVTPEQVDALLHPVFDDKAKKAAQTRGDLLTNGLNASPGAATGIAIFDSERAEEAAKAGEAVILVRPETSPDDVGGMLSSKGVLTQHGGATSHAAVVARCNNLPCVVGCEEIRVNVEAQQFSVGGRVIHEGDILSIDGITGEVFVGTIQTMDLDLARELELATLLSWADERAHAGHLHQRRLSARRAGGPLVWRRGHRPVPHRAHVL